MIFPYRYLFAHFLKKFYCFSVLFYPIHKKEFNNRLTKSFQNFNKVALNIEQAHCSISIRIMKSPLFQRFQHLLYNKPAKVEKQPEIFSDSFHA